MLQLLQQSCGPVFMSSLNTHVFSAYLKESRDIFLEFILAGVLKVEVLKDLSFAKL